MGTLKEPPQAHLLSREVVERSHVGAIEDGDLGTWGHRGGHCSCSHGTRAARPPSVPCPPRHVPHAHLCPLMSPVPPRPSIPCPHIPYSSMSPQPLSPCLLFLHVPHAPGPPCPLAPLCPPCPHPPVSLSPQPYVAIGEVALGDTSHEVYKGQSDPVRDVPRQGYCDTPMSPPSTLVTPTLCRVPAELADCH